MRHPEVVLILFDHIRIRINHDIPFTMGATPLNGVVRASNVIGASVSGHGNKQIIYKICYVSLEETQIKAPRPKKDNTTT